MKSLKLFLNKKWVLDFLKKRVNYYFPNFKLVDCKIDLFSIFLDYHRIVVKYYLRLQDKNGQLIRKTIVGKVQERMRGSEQKSSIQTDYVITKFLSTHNFADIVPRPLDFIPNYNLYLYEFIPGHSLQELSIKYKSEKFFEKIEPIISIIKKIHRFKSTSSKVFKIEKDWEEEERQNNLQLMEKYYNFGFSKLLFLIKNCQGIKKRHSKYFGQKFYRLIHGDFYSRNIIISQNKIKLCDFSDSKIYEPLNDIGNFLINTELMFEYYFHGEYRSLMEKLKNLFEQYYFNRPINKAEKIKINFFVLTNLIRIIVSAAMSEGDRGLTKKKNELVEKLLKIGEEKSNILNIDL